MAKTKNSMINRVRVSKLGYGIHDNVVITNLDTSDRKRQGIPEKKMLYLTFAVVDPETQKKKAEVELSWFKLDHTSDYLFTNLRELCVQLAGILSSYIPEDDAFTAMGNTFADFTFKEVSDIENHKWRKKDIDGLISTIKTTFNDTVEKYIGDFDKPIRLKVTTDNKGEYTNIPKFGVFTESMDVETSLLKFSDFELRNHSKAGIGTNGAVVQDRSL